MINSIVKKSPAKFYVINTFLIFVVLQSFFWVSCSDNNSSSDETIEIGLLLPFSGSDAAFGNNYERSVILAKEKFNSAGGAEGKKIVFTTKDTRSNSRDAEDAYNSLADNDLLTIIGPENVSAAGLIISQVIKNNQVLVSPVISGSSTIELPQDFTWTRLAPSSSIISRAFANYISDEENADINIIYSEDAYNMDFADSLSGRLTTLGVKIENKIQISENQLSFSKEITALGTAKSKVLVLAASTATAARFINELSGSESKTSWTWYLSPTLETPVLLQNTFNNALDGAIGAGLDVYEKTKDFETAYLKRWNDYPSDGAYYYYDAVTILGLAYARSLYLKEKITYENITSSIIDITTPSGVQVRWNEVDKGIELIKKGRTIYYSGLTGPILLDRNGQQQAAPMKLWTISSDKIEYYDSL